MVTHFIEGRLWGLENPICVLEKATNWLADNYDQITHAVCSDDRVNSSINGEVNDQELQETIASVLSDLTIFQGLPVTNIANILT